MTIRDARHDRRQRRMLMSLASIFFVPLAVSFYLYYGPVHWRPAHHVNHGDLITPARPLPTAALPLAGAAGGDTAPDPLRNKWTLLYWAAGDCDAECRTRLYQTRQVRLALNRDLDRVQRILIAGDCCDWNFLHAEHPDLVTLRADGASAALLALLPSYDAIAPAAAHRIYVIDPLGNLMMSYAADAPPKGLLEDLKRLLNLSHVG